MFQFWTKKLKIGWLADDAIIMAENKEEFQRMLYQYQEIASRYNVKTVIEKNKQQTNKGQSAPNYDKLEYHNGR